MVAGLWSAGLIVLRLFDRPLGQGLLALVCAAIVAGAGLRERSQRPMDDVARAPARPRAAPRAPAPPAGDEPTRRLPDEPTERLPDDATRRLPDEPPEDLPDEPAQPLPEDPTERLPDSGDDATRRLPEG